MAGKAEPIAEGGFEQEVLQADGPVVVMFTASWCGPCIRFKPIFKERAEEMDVPFKIADISDESNPLWDEWGIRHVPTVAIFEAGELKHKVGGFLHDKHLDELLSHLDGA